MNSIHEFTGWGNPLTVDENGIPNMLKDVPAWVAWASEPRGKGKPAKVPYSPRTGAKADVTRATDLVGFDDALSFYLDRSLSGIGFVFRHGGPFAGLDLDNCRDPGTGEFDPFSCDILSELATYAEVSPSRTGAKAVAVGRLDPNGPKRAGNVELYDRGRFFALTGHRLPFVPATIEPREDILLRLQSRLRPPAQSKPATSVVHGGQDGFPGPDAALLARAFRAKNGPLIRSYWSGDHSGKATASEALLGLAQLLAFWTGPDERRLSGLLTRSPLFVASEAERSKWTSNRNGLSWGTRFVVRKAIDTCRAFYSGTLPKSLSTTLQVSPSTPPFKPPKEEHNLCKHGVQFGGSSNPIVTALQLVRKGDFPHEVAGLTAPYAKTRIMLRELAAVCWQLAGRQTGGRFPLATELAGKAFGVDRATLSRRLADLERRGLVKRVKWGNSFSGLASEWVWVGTASVRVAGRTVPNEDHRTGPDRRTCRPLASAATFPGRLLPSAMHLRNGVARQGVETRSRSEAELRLPST